MPANHDTGYKLLFSDPLMVRDLLQGFIDDPWLARLDFSTLELVNGHYVSEDLRNRADDVVWRVKADERWVYLYLLIEFQSRIDRFMALRMLVYVGLLYQDLVRGKQLAPTASFRRCCRSCSTTASRAGRRQPRWTRCCPGSPASSRRCSRRCATC